MPKPPALGLFRCRQLAEHINTPRGDKLLRSLKEAAQVGIEVLDDRARQDYLARLQKLKLADDTGFQGLSSTAKAELLHRFIDGVLSDNRAELLEVLRIDWQEVQELITSRGRVSKAERYQRTVERLQLVAEQHNLVGNNDLADIIDDLQQAREPDSEVLDRFLSEEGPTLNKALRNDLRRMVRPHTRYSADFLVGLAATAIDLLHAQQGLLGPGTQLRVSFATAAVERRDAHGEAASVFRMIYGGISERLATIDWQLTSLWQLADTVEQQAEGDDEEQPETRAEIPFRVTLLTAQGNEIATATLMWQYRSDSPAAATAQALANEQNLLQASDHGPLFAQEAARLRVPIYNCCQPLDEIGDLDLSHPLQSLGPWYVQPSDLRAALEDQLRPNARAAVWAQCDAALVQLEQAWATFITATEGGLLGAEIGPLLTAYEALLTTALNSLSTGDEVVASYRMINQAWLVGQARFEKWAIVPLLHPLKLLWWRERARYFNELIVRLLDHTAPATIVDVKRFQQELAATYGSSSFPPVLALPPGDGRNAARFLPVEEAEGYELYFHEAASAEAFGLDTDLLAENENALAALRAVEGIVAVVQDYIETYPFVRDGIEILLFECRNGALPGLLIEQLSRTARARAWSLRLTVIVHTSERGAPLFRRVSTWVARGFAGTERQGQSYFPAITVKVLECPAEVLFTQHEDTDIVVLADVLAERGQEIVSDLEPCEGDDVPSDGYLPTYRGRQEPFPQGEQYRQIALNAPQQPALVRLFLLAQHAALTKRAPRRGHEARFYRQMTLDHWRADIERLHDRFNWIICYDTSIDRFLLEAAFPNKVQVIRYSLGLGAKRQHNLTVSSSGRSQEIVTQRLATRLGTMFPMADEQLCKTISQHLVNEAKLVSGDIVLRAAGPGAFLNELIGLVAARFATEQRYRAAHPSALTTWILLDDFEHWFSRGKFPDLLFVAIARTDSDTLLLHLEILEAKCIGELSFASEARDAEVQVQSGMARLLPAFTPQHEHLDALYWYDQLYRAVTGNLKVQPEQRELWELFRDQLQTGVFQLDISGHTWVFCYDGQADIVDGPLERPFAIGTNDALQVPLYAHHYGRNELAGLLNQLTHIGQPSEELPIWAQQPMPAAYTQTKATQLGTKKPSLPEVAPPIHITPVAPQRLDSQPTLAEQFGIAEQPVIDEQQWLVAKAKELDRALRRRGVQIQAIKPADADVGPSIVRFKLQLSGQETLRKIQSVAEDLARDLALSRTPIIDNVLRTNFVGVDIPREQPQMIELLPLLNNLGTPGMAELPIIIGVGPDGALVTDDLAAFPHLLVAGATGSGKSVFLRSLLLSLMTQYAPGKIELLIVDPKQTDFSFFEGLPYLRGGKVFTQPVEAQAMLLELVRDEMPRRQQLMRGRSMNIKEFNRRYPQEALPPIVALIDEYAQLMSILNKKDAESFERDLMSLGAVSRSAGIHLVLATQRPSADVVTSTLKANLDARIAFRVASNVNSRVVLDAHGAENLLGRGDMLFRRASGEIIRLQAPFMSEEEMQVYLAQLQEKSEVRSQESEGEGTQLRQRMPTQRLGTARGDNAQLR
ncbi:DNA translocase FtsK [Candidatus Gracilibacteria bacterium]|nr:DNA translocase FtsK [Candidatus Gracilibacteria bacterium]